MQNRKENGFGLFLRCRELLCDVVSMKLKMFEMSKTRNQTAEEYLKVCIPNALSTVRGNFVEAQLTKTQLSLYGLSLFMASSRLFVSLTPSFLFSITAIL